DAVRNLTDLLARMGARVAPVGRELVDRNPANINHRLSLHGRHSEHARADRVATDLQNLSGCFHPHFAGVTIPGHFVTGYRRPRAFRLPAPRVQRVFYPHRGRDHSRPLFTNRLNYPTQTPFLSRPRTMQPAATNH